MSSSDWRSVPDAHAAEAWRLINNEPVRPPGLTRAAALLLEAKQAEEEGEDEWLSAGALRYGQPSAGEAEPALVGPPKKKKKHDDDESEGYDAESFLLEDVAGKEARVAAREKVQRYAELGKRMVALAGPAEEELYNIEGVKGDVTALGWAAKYAGKKSVVLPLVDPRQYPTSNAAQFVARVSSICNKPHEQRVFYQTETIQRRVCSDALGREACKRMLPLYERSMLTVMSPSFVAAMREARSLVGENDAAEWGEDERTSEHAPESTEAFWCRLLRAGGLTPPAVVRLFDVFARRAADDDEFDSLNAVLELPPHRIALARPREPGRPSGEIKVGHPVAWDDVFRSLGGGGSAPRAIFGPQSSSASGAVAAKEAREREELAARGDAPESILVRWFLAHFEPMAVQWMASFDPDHPSPFSTAAGGAARPEWQQWWLFELAQPVPVAPRPQKAPHAISQPATSLEQEFREALALTVMQAAISGREDYVRAVEDVIKRKHSRVPAPLDGERHEARRARERRAIARARIDARRGTQERARLFNKLVGIIMQEYDLRNPRSTSVPGRSERYADLRREKEAVAFAYRQLRGERYSFPFS